MRINQTLCFTLLASFVLCSINGQINGYETLPKEPLFKQDPPKTEFPNYDRKEAKNTIGTNKLDLRNGFKDFTFGDGISKYDSEISTDEYDINGLKKMYSGIKAIEPFYKYTKSDPNELFQVPWQNLLLGFSRKQLTTINVLWITHKSGYYFDTILNGIKKIYGNPRVTDQGTFISYDWKGDNVEMRLTLKAPNMYQNKEMEYYSLTIEAMALKRLIFSPENQF